jgi:predicted dehydrogenase
MDQEAIGPMSERRQFLKTAAAAGLTTNIFPKLVRGANDQIRAGFIGVGAMGSGNLRAAMKQENLEVAAICDIYQPYLDKAMEASGGKAKAYKDFRAILADKSIDVVCISTPDHWHAYMTVEACKAGKDVYVEKPISVTIEEGQLMVKAARKYNRVVQAGTMQRSAEHFQKACGIVQSGALGDVTFCRTWNYANGDPAGFGNPPDGPPPEYVDWDMWQGPAPRHEFNPNRWGIDPKHWSTFRYFWDYAGGWMTDWCVHLIDIVQMAFNESMPTSITALGSRFVDKDNTQMPDTLQVTFEYPKFIAVYENRQFNSNSLFKHGYGITFHGTKGTMFVDRGGYQTWPERGSDLPAEEVRSKSPGNAEHWANFLECVKTRQRPIADVEINHKTSTTCHLGNISYRSKLRVDFDPATETIAQPEARKYFSREQTAPWKIVV